MKRVRLNQDENDENRTEIEKLWMKEVERRVEAYERGEMKVVSLEEVLEKYKDMMEETKNER